MNNFYEAFACKICNFIDSKGIHTASLYFCTFLYLECGDQVSGKSRFLNVVYNTDSSQEIVENDVSSDVILQKCSRFQAWHQTDPKRGDSKLSFDAKKLLPYSKKWFPPKNAKFLSTNKDLPRTNFPSGQRGIRDVSL